jgi:modified peptide precursor CbpA
MAKGFGNRLVGAVEALFSFRQPKGREMKKPKKKDVIAFRKRCNAKGTGLSHYILMDKKAK